MKAFVWRSGQVKVGTVVPAGAIEIAEGEDFELRTAIVAAGRLAYDGKTILVPGVPEAADGYAAMDALLAFKAELEGQLLGVLQDSRP